MISHPIYNPQSLMLDAPPSTYPWKAKKGEIAKGFFILSVFCQSFMEEMTRKQPDVDRVTKTYKRKATEPPHGPFIDKSRSNSESAFGPGMAGNEVPRKLISCDCQLTRHPALAATRKALSLVRRGESRWHFPKEPCCSWASSALLSLSAVALG